MSRKRKKKRQKSKPRTNVGAMPPLPPEPLQPPPLDEIKSDAQVRVEQTEGHQENYIAALRIGIVTHRHILPQTMTSCWGVNRMVQGGAEIDVHALAYVDIGRNQIATKALQAGNPYLLFVDFDMDFPPQTIGLMKDALDANPEIGAIAAHYVKWDGSGEAMAHWRVEDGQAWISPEERDEMVKEYQSQNAVVEVDRFGTGCMLIKTEILTKVPYPWFQLWFHEDHGHVGEDVHFCWALQRAGFHPSCHFGAIAGHLGPTMWMPVKGSGRGTVAVREEMRPENQNKAEDVPGKPKISGHPVSHQVGGPEQELWPSQATLSIEQPSEPSVESS